MEMFDDNKKGRFAFVVPVYNHEKNIVNVVNGLLKFDIPIIVVDDGSTDSTYNNIKDINNIIIISHKKNKGKGAAIITGMRESLKVADWVITIDADGQHNPDDAINLVNAIPNDENILNDKVSGVRPIIIGMRKDMFGSDVPWTSSFGRKFSNFWVWASGGPGITDTQSGFRIYPVPECLNLRTKAKRFQFEVEIVVRANWKGIPVVEAPISVNYSPEGGRVSHFRPFLDFLRNSSTFCGLIFSRIFIPKFIRKKL